jgi:hypothetical protein
MFSRRIHWDLQPNRISQLLAEKRRGAERILDLTESNPTAAGFAYPPEVITALADTRALLYEPLPNGLEASRAAVQGYYEARGAAVETERVLLTTSTSESYGYLFKLLCDPGDEVLVPRPSYPLFDFLATLESVRVVQYPLSYHGEWVLDFEAFRAALTPRTRAVVLVNPNNPTGSFLKQDELRTLVALCRERDIAIISDEVFADYVFDEDPRRVASLIDVDEALTFCLSGLSKVSALPQMKLGWMVVSGPPDLRREALERLELIADTYLSVATPVQHALPALLAARVPLQQQMRARLDANLEYLRERLRSDCTVRMLQVEGGWYATLQAPRVKSEEEWVLDLLSHCHVLVQPGFFYDFESEAYLVLSLLTREADFMEGVERLLARIGASL